MFEGLLIAGDRTFVFACLMLSDRLCRRAENRPPIANGELTQFSVSVISPSDQSQPVSSEW